MFLHDYLTLRKRVTTKNYQRYLSNYQDVSYSETQAIKSFLGVIVAIKSLGPRQLSSKNISKHKSLANNVLRIIELNCPLQTTHFMRADLHWALSKAYHTKGNIWKSHMERDLAITLGKSDSDILCEIDKLGNASRLFEQGLITEAFENYSKIEKYSSCPELLLKSSLGAIKCLRLLGRETEARTYLNKLKKLGYTCRQSKTAIMWESICLDISRDGSISDQQVNEIIDYEELSEDIICQLYLKIYASRKRCVGKTICLFRSIIRNKSYDFSGHHLLVKFIKYLENGYENNRNFESRFYDICTIMERIHELENPDLEQHLRLAVIRWAKAYGLGPFFKVATDEYISKSLMITNRTSIDSTGLGEDILVSDFCRPQHLKVEGN